MNTLLKSTESTKTLVTQDNKSYVAYSGCVLEHILNTSTLNHNEKLYYILADSLSLINSKNAARKRSVSISSQKWSEQLNRSRTEIFAMQKSLEEKGYFAVIRETNGDGKNKRNLIIPTLPDDVLHELVKTPDKLNCDTQHHTSFTPVSDVNSPYLQANKRIYLDNKKLFIKLDYHLLKTIISSEELSAFAKVIFIDLYSKSYKSFMLSRSSFDEVEQNNLSLTISYQELEQQYSCSKAHLSKVLRALQMSGFINKTRIRFKKDEDEDSLYDKNLWKVSLPILKHFQFKNSNPTKQTISSLVPQINQFGHMYNRDKIIENSINLTKNTDSLDRSNLSESSKFSQNNKHKTNYNTENKKNTKFNPKAELKDWGPLSQKDVDRLNLQSDRNFSLNFVNELLLKLNSKYSNRTFPTKNHVFSYMTKALQQELHQDLLVNHDTFKFVKHDPEAMEISRKEKFLKVIEESENNSLQAQLNRKIAATFCKDIAYLLLTEAKIFIKSSDHPYIKNVRLYTCTLLLPCSTELNSHQKTKFHDSVSAVYGFSQVIYKNFSNSSNNDTKPKFQEFPLETIDSDSLWYKVRTQLIKKYDINIDKSWFSKILAQENLSSKTITLMTPSPFFSSYIKNHYGHIIQQLVQHFGFQYIEFNSKQKTSITDNKRE